MTSALTAGLRQAAGGVVVVGAAAAGIATVEALRRKGYAGPIRLVGAEQHLPYDRPPLSKTLLDGDPALDHLALRTADELGTLDISMHLGVRATSVDAGARRVRLSDGDELAYEHLVVATGVKPRQLPVAAGITGVHYLRTLDDARGLRDELVPDRRIVVVGGGLVGTEIASVAAEAGLHVHLLHRGDGLLDGAGIGGEVEAWLRGLHTARAVDVRTGPAAQVTGVEQQHNALTGVVLADGTRIAADLLLVAIGAEPCVDWLRSVDGLDLTDGVRCDAYLRAAPGISAVGDVCSWSDPRTGKVVRIEHRTNATEQGVYVADMIVNGPTAPFTTVPYFWTEQCGTTLHAYGSLRGHDEARVVHGAFEEGRFVVAYLRDNRLVGVLGVRSAKVLRRWRASLEAGEP